MPMPTLEELRRWYEGLTEQERVCRVWMRDEIHSGICARSAVGIDRMAGPRGLVCDAHKPANRDWFVRLRE